ncbi:MAG: hypothetical protein EOP35_22395 [Rubrivivax sp.]|nr:MAG: hypothetical protein EOP35_22395 [Rubrivivax sp.]
MIALPEKPMAPSTASSRPGQSCCGFIEAHRPLGWQACGGCASWGRQSMLTTLRAPRSTLLPHGKLVLRSGAPACPPVHRPRRSASPRRVSMNVLASLLISCALFAAPHAATAANTAETSPADSAGGAAPAPSATYVVIYRPGPAWPAGKTIAELPLKDHFNYLIELYARGAMKQGGPLTDNAGGLVILEVADAAQAQALAAGDPAVKAGLFLAEVHPWTSVPWAKYLKK